MKILFLDESGDHNLSIIDPQYPVFVLGGVIVDQAYAEGEMAERVADFKRRVFGRDDIVLHTAEIVRNEGPFEGLIDRAFRERFYRELNALMATLQYQVVACAVRKDEHLARYGVAALDPYMLSLDILVERFCFEIGRGGAGVIVAEKRDAVLDGQLELAWLNLKIQGTRYVPAQAIRERVQGLTTRHKRENIAGLQLADLIVSPIGRKVLGKPVREDYRIIEQKLRGWPRNHAGQGLVVLPR